MRSQWLRISSPLCRNGSAGAAGRLYFQALPRTCRHYSSLAEATPAATSPPLPPSPPPSLSTTLPPPSPSLPSSTTSVSSKPPPPTRTRTSVQPSILERSPRRRELYDLLKKLDEKERDFDTRGGDMYLATEQLWEDNPLLRISLVGLEELSKLQESDSERIAKLLLLASEAVVPKETEWEKFLKGANKEWMAISIRYNERAEMVEADRSTPYVIHTPNPLLSPSTELVVGNLDSPTDKRSSPLFPDVITAKMGIGYPVHKALVVVKNFEELLSNKMLWEAKTAGERDRVRIVVDVDTVTLEMVRKMKKAGAEGEEGRMFICSSLAQDALDKFRNGKGGVDEFKKAMEDSGMTRLAEYIKAQANKQPEGGSDDPGRLPEHLRQLIFSILSTPLPDMPRFDTASSTATPSAPRSLSPGNSRKELRDAVSSWSRASHSELTRELDAGYSTKPYRRLSWWRLLFNVDDVRCACEGVVRGYFLRDAERKSWFLAGKVAGAGYKLPEGIKVVKDAAEVTPPGETSGSETSITASSHLQQHEKDRIMSQAAQPQYPSHISEARNRIILQSVPPLHLKAQKHIVQFLSTATLASATGVLMYLSEFSVYSSLSVFSLLGVYSLRRLQVGWGRAKREWEMDVRDEGRKAIAGVEDWVGVCLSGEAKTHEPITSGKTKEEVEKMRDEAYKKRNETHSMIAKGKRLLEEL